MTAGAAAGPLLTVKQSIPPVRPGSVPRPWLEQRLRESASRLTVVVAPAGWGKTSLLSRWAAATAGSTPVAWVSLDESDDEPVRFWSYVLASLSRVSDAVSPAAMAALPTAREGPMAQALPLLLNDLTASPREHVLVLDDLHVITDHEVHESLEFLITYLPASVRLVVAGRFDPPLPLARMRARGDLTELRARDLRFSPDESQGMLSAVTGTELDAALTRAVWERTEGWAAGLHLAGLTLRSRDADDRAARLAGGDRHIFDYFAAEILPALRPEQRDLLVRAAPLELLSGPLCDAALGREGSADVLESLERADLFVVALDEEREWYRCHRLLRDALRRTAEGRAGEGHRDVLRRAARWFEGQRRIDDAVRHHQAAGDHEAAAVMLEAEQSWFLERGLAGTLLALGERLPGSTVTPQLAIFLAYAAEVSGHRDRVVPWLDVCAHRTGPGTVVAGWHSARAAELALRGVIGVPESDPGRAIAMCEEAVALDAAGGTEAHPVAMIALGRAYGLAGRFDEAARILTDARRQRERGRWSTGADLEIAGVLGLVLLQAGRPDELDRLLQEVMPLADAVEADWGDACAHMVALLRLVRARRDYERGALAEAATGLAHGLRLAELAGRPLHRILGLVLLADVELADGRRARARDALVRARELADNDPVAPFVLATLERAETRMGRTASRTAVGSGALFEELTDRELSILRMLPGTATQREIGAALFVSVNTVKAYNKSLYRKLGVGGRQDAVRAARRLGLI